MCPSPQNTQLKNPLIMCPGPGKISYRINWLDVLYMFRYVCSRFYLRVANKFPLLLILLCEAWRQQSAHLIGPQPTAFHMHANGRDRCQKKTGSALHVEQMEQMALCASHCFSAKVGPTIATKCVQSSASLMERRYTSSRRQMIPMSVCWPAKSAVRSQSRSG